MVATETLESQRIEAGRVRAAYIQLGWTPGRKDYGNNCTKCGCGIGVLRQLHGVSAYEVCGRNEFYKLGYIVGFDGHALGPECTTKDELLGYADGRRDWLDVQDLIPTS